MGPRPTTPQSTSWRSMFVGRDEELSWLQAAWERVQAGEPQLCVVRGESGLGKTRVVQAFYASYRPLSQDRGTLVLADVLLEDALDRAGHESPTIA